MYPTLADCAKWNMVPMEGSEGEYFQRTDWDRTYRVYPGEVWRVDLWYGDKVIREEWASSTGWEPLFVLVHDDIVGRTANNVLQFPKNGESSPNTETSPKSEPICKVEGAFWDRGVIELAIAAIEDQIYDGTDPGPVRVAFERFVKEYEVSCS